MKRTKLITTLAITTLAFSACGNSEEAATEPEIIEEQETKEATTDQETPETEASDVDELAYLDSLSHLYTALSDDELLQEGYDACDRIQRDQSDPDTVTGDNIQAATNWVSTDLDVDETYDVVRVAVYNFCPEITDKFDYEAMRSGPFFDDFEEERRPLQDDY